MKRLLLTLILCAMAQISFACFCGVIGPLTIEEIEDSVDIIEARILHVVKENTTMQHAEILITKSYKSTYTTGDTVNISIPLTDANCGFKVRKRQRWYFWASDFGTNELKTDICMRNVKLSGIRNKSRYRNDIKLINQYLDGQLHRPKANKKSKN